MLQEYFLDGKLVTVDKDIMDNLSSGIQVTIDDCMCALLHASVANHSRATQCNVYDHGYSHELFGYLSGPEYSELSTVCHLHSVHSPKHQYDLNMMFYTMSMANTLKQ